MLAERLGRTVGELEQTISAQEVSEWVAYFEYKQEQARPPEERVTYDANEMRARFERLKSLQKMQGKSILERQR